MSNVILYDVVMASTSSSDKKSPLLEIVENHLIPRLQQTGASHTVVMPVQEESNSLPLGVRVEKYAFKGERVPLKHFRDAAHMSVKTAIWPQDALCEKNVPFFLYVLAGNASIQIGEQQISCGSGTFIFIPPGLPHPDGQRPYNTDQQLCSLLWIRRCGPGLRCWISHSKNTLNFRPGYGETVYFSHEQLVHVFETLCDQLMQNRIDELYYHALQLLLHLFQREIVAGRAFDIPNGQGIHLDDTETYPLDSDPLELAQEYIQAHLAQPLTLEKLARHFHMSRSSFARLFHQGTGKTFLDYLHEQRIRQACIYLRETSWTINTIAELCGYASESGFHRFFTRHQGITPHTYRKQIELKIENEAGSSL